MGALSEKSSNVDQSSPLENEIKAIDKAANKIHHNSSKQDQHVSEMKDFVQRMVNSIPREALVRGVYSDKALRDRYFRVENMAKRTALIKEEEPSLFMYLLSYLQSLVLISPSTEKLPPGDVNIDIDGLSNYDAIGLARGCVERGDIAQAVRYLNLLQGQSAKVSKDWIEEARILLETQQACNALLAHAAAFGLEIFPKQKELNSTEKSCCHGKR